MPIPTLAGGPGHRHRIRVVHRWRRSPPHGRARPMPPVASGTPRTGTGPRPGRAFGSSVGSPSAFAGARYRVRTLSAPHHLPIDRLKPAPSFDRPRCRPWLRIVPAAGPGRPGAAPAAGASAVAGAAPRPGSDRCQPAGPPEGRQAVGGLFFDRGCRVRERGRPQHGQQGQRHVPASPGQRTTRPRGWALARRGYGGPWFVLPSPSVGGFPRSASRPAGRLSVSVTG